MMYVPRDYSNFFPPNSAYRFGSVLQQRAGVPIGFSGNVPFEVNMTAWQADPNPLPVNAAVEALGLDPEKQGRLGPGLDPGIGTGGYAPELRDAALAALPENWMDTRLGDAFKKFGLYVLGVVLIAIGVYYFIRKPAEKVITSAAKVVT